MVRWALKQPYTVIVIALMLMVVGLFSMFRLPTDILPVFRIPAVMVVTTYTGMPAEVMETDITNRLERWLSQASGLDHIESRSLIGVSILNCFFTPGFDPNNALAQISPTYYRELARYGKIAKQKGALLRGSVEPDRELLLAYNDALVAPGAALIAARRDFVAALALAAAQIYERWQGTREQTVVAYAPNVAADDDPADALRAALAANVDAELRRRTTLVGPHRDDVRLTLAGKPLDAYGSQGQQRTAVLALKVAEYETMHARTGDAPILLLDDVLSELDADRAAGFLNAIGTFEQAFLTATDLSPQFAGGRRHRIVDATISSC